MKLFNNIYRILAMALTIVAITSLSSCHKKSKEPTPPVDPNAVSRTVLVYMAANNSLGTNNYDQLDLDEMHVAVDRGDLNGGRLLVFHAPRRGTQRLIEITPGGGEVELKTYGDELTSVNPERMGEVLRDMRVLAAAADYGLVLWSHGSGWIETSGSRSATPGLSRRDDTAMPYSWGQDGKEEMKITSLAKTIADNTSGDLSFIYFDACLMGTVEVVYELRNVTKEIIASGTELQVTGMRYDRNIPVFFAKNRDLKKAAQNTFDSYAEQTAPYNSCTISYIVTSELDNLAAATRAIMATGALPADNYRRIPYGSSTYGLYDMPDYIRHLPVDQSLIDRWNSAYALAVPYFAHSAKYGNLDTSNYGGLGTYIIDNPYLTDWKGYDNSAWWRDVVSANPSLATAGE